MTSPGPKRKNLPSLSLAPITLTNETQPAVDRLTEVISELKVAKMDLKESDFEDKDVLGSGSAGVVRKTKHIPTGTIMAKKTITFATKPEERKLIERELEFMKTFDSDHIVSFYGAFVHANEICVCMEFMDVGSFDDIYRKMKTIPEDILGQITVSVLEGLTYLYRTHKIIHRDIKPSNILLNSRGQVKICDFGVSGVLLNTCDKAETFVGTSFYMSPARIQGQPYSVQSDSWSLGLSLVEMAIGSFPIKVTKNPNSKSVGIFDLVSTLVKEPSPKLPSEGFTPEFQDFIAKCLVKKDDQRLSPPELLEHPFVLKSKQQKVDMADWARKVLAP